MAPDGRPCHPETVNVQEAAVPNPTCQTTAPILQRFFFPAINPAHMQMENAAKVQAQATA